MRLKALLRQYCPDSIRPINFAIYLLLLGFCFIFFQQGDLHHTVKSSDAFLYGHILDFYDYNKTVVAYNDYFPLLYLVFALWALPLRVLGLISPPKLIEPSMLEVFWAKLLLVLVFFITAGIVYRIAQLLTQHENEKSKVTATVFASAPLAIFAVFIFGQYDILGVMVSMLGIYYYFQKEMSKFAWFFSIAISFKFFALVIFIPLLFLAEKRLSYIAKYIAIATLIPLVQVGIYWHNLAFRHYTIFALAGNKIKLLAEYQQSAMNHGIIFILFYALICGWAYIKEHTSTEEWQKNSIFLALVSYALFFSTVCWHPQWLILITPFFALASIYILQIEKFYLLEIIGMLAFTCLVVIFHRTNVDVTLAYHGFFGKWLPHTFLYNADILPKDLFSYISPIFFLYLFSPLLVYLIQSPLSTAHPLMQNKYFNARFYLGIGFFVISSLFCLIVPQKLAIKIFPHSYRASLKTIAIGTTPNQPIGEISKGKTFTQSFVATEDKLTMISIMMATYARENNSTIRFALLNDEGQEISANVADGRNIKDNSYYAIPIAPIEHSKGKCYRLVISSPDADLNNALTAWRTADQAYQNGKLKANNLVLPGDLVMKLHFSNE